MARWRPRHLCPLNGDQHPRFGCDGGENDVPQVAEFLEALFNIKYLGPGRRPIVAFEVKPYGDENSATVIAQAKRTMLSAWAAVPN